MIGYLLDTSAIWHIFRNPDVANVWHGQVRPGALHVCEVTRTEFLFSATGPADRDALAEELDDLAGLVPVPKTVWRWVDTAQYKLTLRGQHRAAGPVDLVVCATAVHHDLTVLHVDNDFAAIASVLTKVRQLDIRC